MTESGEDREIRVAFGMLRRIERPRIPDFQQTLRVRADAHRRPGKLIWLRLAGSVAVLAAVWLMLGQRILNRERGRFEQTAAGLPDSLLRFIPEPGVALPGSPLRVLDPGEPLGPSFERSPPQ